jgi:hypothetical protein
MELKNETELRQANVGEFILRIACNCFSVQQDRAAGRPVQQAEKIKQRGLAGT